MNSNYFLFFVGLTLTYSPYPAHTQLPLLPSTKSPTTMTSAAAAAVDLRILHFLIPIPNPVPRPSTNSDNNSNNGANSQDSLALAKLGTHDWRCRLSILEDSRTIRANLAPIPLTEANMSALGDCCTLQVLASNVGSSEVTISLDKPVLLVKKVRPDELFNRGIECETLYPCQCPTKNPKSTSTYHPQKKSR